MNKNSSLTWVLAVLFVFGATAQLKAQEPPKPTKYHKVLAKEAGVWDVEMKLWLQGPDGDPTTSKGVEVNRLLGGLWLETRYEGSFVGERFSGRGHFGYDPLKKKFTGTWIDNTSPHMSIMSGDYDEKKSTLTYMATGVDPATGEPMKSKHVGRYIDKDTRTMTMYLVAGGELTKLMELHYKRRPARKKKPDAKKSDAKKQDKKKQDKKKQDKKKP